jgi:ribosomal protein S18 acetylase RimI-like enzyme
MSHPISIRLMQPEDLDTLYFICREAYSRNFHHHWDEGGLEGYLETVFGRTILAAELADPDIRYYVAFQQEAPVAFIKMNLRSNLPGEPAEEGVELDKLYILPGGQGLKIGGSLIDLVFQAATTMDKRVCWLAVLDTNKPAIAFYERYGFRFHSTTRVGYPGFREELRGMWRMQVEIKKDAPAV